MRPRILTQPEIVAEVAELYRQGLPISRLMARYGHTARWIYRRLAEAGVKPSRVPPGQRFRRVGDDPDMAEIRRLRRHGAYIHDIAKQFHRSVDYIIRRLDGVTPPLKVKPELPPIPESQLSSNEIGRMLLLRAQGLSYGKIAKRLRRPLPSIREQLLWFGIRIHDEGWPRPIISAKKAYGRRKYDDIPDCAPGSYRAAVLMGQRYQNRSQL